MREVLATLTLLCPQPPIEIRALSDRMHVRRFEDHDAAARWAESEGETAKAVYVVMNPFSVAKIRGAAVDDQAVVSRRWMLIDVDPARPPDSNATRGEMGVATSTAVAVEGFLGECGFPAPVRALSGSGAHLLYRVDLPNDAESCQLIGSALKYLALEFSDEGGASVDTTVGNAARITKLYGTMVRKGPNTPERPHRASKITRVPSMLAVVPLAALRGVAARLPVPPRPVLVPSPNSGGYDLAQVLARVPVQRTFAKDGSTWHVIRCPWAREHSTEMEDEATVLTVGTGGGLGFKCLHAHCEGRKWEDFRDHLGIETKGWQERNTKREWSRLLEEHHEEKLASRVTIADVARRSVVLQRMAEYTRTGAMPGSVSTGMSRLDRMLLGGLRPGKLYVLGGESGRGKTTLLLQWAFHAGRMRPDRVVAIVSPEMDPESMDERAYSQLTGVSLSAYRHWPAESREKWAAVEAPQNVRASFDPKDIQAFASDEKPCLFIVDYAQQAVDYEAERRHTALGRLGADCLSIAKSLWIPVVLGTQVNVTADRDFTVRETRIIEHQSDVLMFLDVQYEKAPGPDGQRQLKPGTALVLEKNRHGATGRIPIIWERECFRFTEAQS